MNEDYDAEDESNTDENLMPPPPIPINRDQKQGEIMKNDDSDKKKLETPLAAMLPSKYANIDVTELFPDFRHGKVSINSLHEVFKYKTDSCSKRNLWAIKNIILHLLCL